MPFATKDSWLRSSVHSSLWPLRRPIWNLGKTKSVGIKVKSKICFRFAFLWCSATDWKILGRWQEMSKITAHSLLWLKATWAHWIRTKGLLHTAQPRILAFWDKTPVNIKYCIIYFVSSLHGFLLGAERALRVFVWHSIQALCLWRNFSKFL